MLSIFGNSDLTIRPMIHTENVNKKAHKNITLNEYLICFESLAINNLWQYDASIKGIKNNRIRLIMYLALLSVKSTCL